MALDASARVEETLQQLAFYYRDRIIAEHDIRELAGMTRPRLSRTLEALVQTMMTDERRILTKSEHAHLIELLQHEVVGFGPLEPLLAQEDITEIMVVGPDEVYIERSGRIFPATVQFRDEQHIRHIVDRIIASIGRRLDDSSPMVDARLPDGSRINAIIPPVAVNGTALTVRKFRQRPLKLLDLLDLGALPSGAVHLLAAAVRSKMNLAVSGGTGSGKTTALGALAAEIDPGERLLIVEDMTEIRLNRKHVISLEARPANTEGRGEITIRQLVRNALRMRPDRIIVGEVRGPEAFDLLQAMNTGHEGSLTTFHANSPQDALTRLEAMVIMATSQMPVNVIREHMVGALDLIVQVERLPDGQRKFVSIAEILPGQAGLQEIYRFERTGRGPGGRVEGHFQVMKGLPHLWERLVSFGQAPDPGVLGEGCE